MAGLESVSQRSTVLNARTGQPISTEQYEKLNKMTLDPGAIRGQNKLEKTPQQDTTTFTSNKGEKVTFGEGIKLVAKGFANKAGDMLKAIVQHPVKTLGTVALTTLGLAALPLIGVSMATGAAALALGFAAFAVGKTVVHTAQAVKHNNNGEYNEVRNDLRKIGGDGLDLALSLPFIPKALKQVQRHLKYNPKLLYINKEMVTDLQQAKNVKDIAYSFLKGDLRVKYHQITNEMGFKVKPELVFEENIPTMLGGLYDPTTGQMKMNTSWLNPIKRLKMKAAMKAAGAKPAVSNLSPEGFLRHELEHVRQFQDIARTEKIGVTGLQEALRKYHSERMPQLEQGLEQTKLQYNTLKDIAAPNKMQQAQLAEVNKTLKYLEGEIKISKQVAANPETAINTGFYKQAAEQAGTIKAGSQEAALAKQYLDGFLDKLNDGQKMQELSQRAAVEGMSSSKFNDEMLKIYKGNFIEQEAYGAQELFIKDNIKGRPGIGTVLTQEIAAINNPA